MSSDRVFFIGGTGNIGAKAVQDLLAKNVEVTLFAHNPAKVETMFPNGKINVVKGDFTDLSPLKEGIQGHARLFLLINDLVDLVQLKKEIAKVAYEAGVKQILDISSFSVNMGWRSNYIGSIHYEAEKAIYDIPNRGRFVTLRPNRFMSNLLTFDRPAANGMIFDTADADEAQGWISTNDIGAVAANILSGDIERFGDSVYSMTGEVVTPIQRAEIFSRVLNREVRYQKITPVQKYSKLSEIGIFPDYVSYDLSTYIDDAESSRVTAGIPILLGRDMETMEQFITANKDKF